MGYDETDLRYLPNTLLNSNRETIDSADVYVSIGVQPLNMRFVQC